MGGRHSNRKASDQGPQRPNHSDLFSPARHGLPSESDPAAVAFDAVAEQHRAALYAYVLRLTRGDEAGARSIVKETLYRASQDPARTRQRPSAVRPWLVMIARTVFAGSPAAPAAAVVPADVTAPGPEPRAPDPATSTTVVRAMDELSRVHREILVELFYGGVSLEDAAAARGVPVETIKSRLYYAMRALRVVLDQQAG